MLRIERIRKNIVRLGQSTAEDQAGLRDAMATARQWLSDAPRSDALRRHLAPLLAEVDAGARRWQGCVPCQSSAIDTIRDCEEVDLEGVVLIGVDGSQIYPDPHAVALYYLLQVGAVVFRYNRQPPSVETREWLQHEASDLYDAQGYLISPETLGSIRLVREIQMLSEVADQERDKGDQLTYAISDGPLLWPYTDRSADSLNRRRAYLRALQQVQLAGGIPVGYVDRPGGRALLELLWASRLSKQDLLKRADESPLRRHRDVDLVERLLPPGAWTPWFVRPTPTNRRHAQEGQEIWFCYANSGSEGQPAIARIEVPAWATKDFDAMTRLQAALLHQATALDGYPYVLARAHEEALVTARDREMLEQMIQRELLSVGVLAQASSKARQKRLIGRA